MAVIHLELVACSRPKIGFVFTQLLDGNRRETDVIDVRFIPACSAFVCINRQVHDVFPSVLFAVPKTQEAATNVQAVS